MNRELFLSVTIAILVGSSAVRADDLRDQINQKLSAQGQIKWAAKSPADSTQVYYFENKDSPHEIFPITCTLLREGGSFCIRGAPGPTTPPAFVIPAH